MKWLVPFLPLMCSPGMTSPTTSGSSREGALVYESAQRLGHDRRAHPKVAGKLDVPNTKGPQRPLPGGQPHFGASEFLSNKPAAKSCSCTSLAPGGGTAGRGEWQHDIPGFLGLRDFDLWAEEGPPKGTFTTTRPHPIRPFGYPAHRAPDAGQINRQATITGCCEIRKAASRWTRHWHGRLRNSKA
jgi:hypothetical protein